MELAEQLQVKKMLTIEELRKLNINTVVAIKFVGDLHKEIQVISSDVTGLISVTTFTDSFFYFRADT